MSQLRVRQQLETKIEELIGLLDLFDGDPDLEPYLADTPGTDREGNPADDREGDDSDYEPEETDQNGDEQDCSFTEEDSMAGLIFDGSGVSDAERMVRGLPTFNDRPTMKALIAAGYDPDRSEIKRKRRQGLGGAA